MSKPTITQLDRFEQRLTLHLELENGETYQPAIYLRGLLRTQSLEAWNGRQAEFAAWIREQMHAYNERLQVHIWGHSKETIKTFRLVWSPEGKTIATVQARNMTEARRQTPKPYRKFMGEVYAEEIK